MVAAVWTYVLLCCFKYRALGNVVEVQEVGETGLQIWGDFTGLTHLYVCTASAWCVFACTRSFRKRMDVYT